MLLVSGCEIFDRVDHFDSRLMPDLDVIYVSFEGLVDWPSDLVELLEVILHGLSVSLPLLVN